MHVTMLLYPRLTQLDLTGPFEVFARVPGVTIDLVWKERGGLVDASGLHLFATHAFHDAPPTDVLFVPGGPGIDGRRRNAHLPPQKGRAGQIRYIRLHGIPRSGGRWIVAGLSGDLPLDVTVSA